MLLTEPLGPVLGVARVVRSVPEEVPMRAGVRFASVVSLLVGCAAGETDTTPAPRDSSAGVDAKDATGEVAADAPKTDGTVDGTGDATSEVADATVDTGGEAAADADDTAPIDTGDAGGCGIDAPDTTTPDALSPETSVCSDTTRAESDGACGTKADPAPRICDSCDLAKKAGIKLQKTFSYTGSDQPFVVPPGVTSIRVKLWGAGGGSDSSGGKGPGGGGGYAQLDLAVTAGETLTIVVGEGGKNPFSQTIIYGGGGHGGYYAGNGGGRSGIRRSTTEHATAGGGGGGAGCNSTGVPCGYGGAGGFPGQDGQTSKPVDGTYGLAGLGGTNGCGGNGGLTSCGCGLTNGAGKGGSSLRGGETIIGAPGQGAGGGGGGWYGGGAGGGDCGGNTGGGGGGGSCWAAKVTGCVLGGVSSTPANTADPDYSGTAGAGGTAGGNGSNGLVLVYY